ncbi:hypothetical protein [Komagataeibacter sp. FNDCF1]|uniref:hypothetical protein n=1 Tax=Komagataeibacter sp. FNDCF1 TaxID=2878681 RepID=UPI001E3D6608|nr:hypothetical protein [Komagataeibacter sp. FNDCF1]MCE2565574.1 hypothetical protein [Komagataeibacter sp. FNDCF1]
MTQTEPTPDPRTQVQTGGLQATARLMRLEAGTYCIFHASGPARGAYGPLSGMRISPPPGMAGVQVSTFDTDGWIGGHDGAALVRVPPPGGAVLVTTYRATEGCELPGLQVVRLAGTAPRVAPAATAAPAHAEAGSMVAHIQRRGDVKVPLGAWMGQEGSGQWLEGFVIGPASGMAMADLEYQAILGQDWFSPWVEGGQYCGSRGMALPLLGLRVRLKDMAARNFTCRVEASFTDGTRMGPVEDEPLMAPSQAPLEAFRIEIRPRADMMPPPMPDRAAEDSLLAACTDADIQPVVTERPRRGRRGRPQRPPVADVQEAPPQAAGNATRAPGHRAPGDRTTESKTAGNGKTGDATALETDATPSVPWWHRRPDRAAGDATPAPGRRGKAPRRSRARTDA